MPFETFVVILTVVVIVLILSGSGGRRNAPPMHPRACRSCGAGHPPFAQYCRRCGQRL